MDKKKELIKLFNNCDWIKFAITSYVIEESAK